MNHPRRICCVKVQIMRGNTIATPNTDLIMVGIFGLQQWRLANDFTSGFKSITNGNRRDPLAWHGITSTALQHLHSHTSLPCCLFSPALSNWSPEKLDNGSNETFSVTSQILKSLKSACSPMPGVKQSASSLIRLHPVRLAK